ncbi:hypothetical protein MCOR25_000986 [Pyricularia grisea]|nr:hypothetical protein MCOR25_000986 [Pyricularia grisea]
MEHPRTDDDPWRPGWNPRRLATLTRPDPRYYRYVPDLSGYFVVAHYQTPDWRPGEGDPGSIRWLREEAPDLIVDGRLRVNREDVSGETSSCLAGGGGVGAIEGRVRAQEHQKSPSSAPPVARPFGGRPGWGGGESTCDQSYGVARDYPQHGRQGWQTGENKSQPHLHQRHRNLENREVQDQQSRFQHSMEQADSRKYAPLQHQQQRPTPQRHPSNESSDDPRRSWIWPETSEVASSGQQPDPRHMRISRDVLSEIHRFPMGYPQSPWGWPEDSDGSGVTEEESIEMREARRRHNAEIEKRAPHPKRYIRPSSPSAGNWGLRRDSRDGSTSSSNSSSAGFPMKMPQWPGAQERFAGSRDSPSYLHGARRISHESLEYTDSSGSGETHDQRRGNYVYGDFEERASGAGTWQSHCLENRFATLQVGRDEGHYVDNSAPRAAWDGHYRRREPVPFQPQSRNQPLFGNHCSSNSLPPWHQSFQKNGQIRNSWPQEDQRRQQPRMQQQQQLQAQRYPPSDF